MTSLTAYNALFDAVRTRRRRVETPKGLDILAARLRVWAMQRSTTLTRLTREAQAIDREISPALRSTSEGALDAMIDDCRTAVIRLRGRTDPLVLRRAMGLTREVARRQTGEEAYIVQLVGALALVHGRIIEMLTGEGKTLTGSLAAPVLAWRHKHLHVFTVNDYLASRDAQSRQPIFSRCRLSVGAIQQETEPGLRRAIYAKDVVFGTPKQITADWLRDQIALQGAGAIGSAWAGRRAIGELGGGPMVPGLRAALVDEADAVLIDEGVVPLIIARSRRTDEMADVYRAAATMARQLDEGPDFTVEHLKRRAVLKPRGLERCRQMFAGQEHAIFRAPRRAEELVKTALTARHCYLRGQHYAIVDGRIVIVDEYTGRFLADRNWEHGLHQAVEAKENLEVTADRETLARLSFQRFFRSYPILAGMTGTAADATGEIKAVYMRPVVVVPTHRPIARQNWPLRFFKSSEARWCAVADSIAQIHATGRPILVGTRSIEASETVAARLAARGLAHKVLNANFDKDEAAIIAGGGRSGSIIVATNMAGRGTDIVLDKDARAAGGLHVILTEMHQAKRIDRQFIGRAGRQGDPGSAQIFASSQDELVRLYARRGVAALIELWSGDEAPPRFHRMVRGFLRGAQRLAEARARRQRADLMRQDHWIERHLPGM